MKALFYSLAVVVVVLAVSASVPTYGTLSPSFTTSLYGAGCHVCHNACATNSECTHDCQPGSTAGCGYEGVSGAAYYCDGTGTQTCTGTLKCKKKPCTCDGNPGAATCVLGNEQEATHSDCI